MAEYDKSKDKQLFKKGSNPTGDKWINVGVYAYDGGEAKVRIMPAGRNKKAEKGDKNEWINHKAVTGITKEEAKELVKLLEQAIVKM